MMLSKEIRALTTDEVGVKLDAAYQELFNLRFQMSTGQMKNTARLTQVKRDIARLKTILRERELEAWYAEGRGA